MSQTGSGSEASVLYEEGGFRYTVATEKFGDDIVRVLSESFSREPMCAALGFSARALGPLIARFMPECTTNGLSVIATPKDQPETLAGVFICRDFKSPLPHGVPEEFPWFLPVAEALGTVDEGIRNEAPWAQGRRCRRFVDGWCATGQSIRQAGHREQPLSHLYGPCS
jgi:hypothetical protein